MKAEKDTNSSNPVGVARPMWRQLFRIDPDAPNSLQAQLRQELVKAILDGRVAQDCPLPSSRALATELASQGTRWCSRINTL